MIPDDVYDDDDALDLDEDGAVDEEEQEKDPDSEEEEIDELDFDDNRMRMYEGMMDEGDLEE